MTWDDPDAAPGDAELVAYLDGELSPADSVRMGQRLAADAALADRANLLMRGGRPFRDAFAPLLDAAPGERLDAMLSAALDRGTPASAKRGGWLPRRGRALAAAAVVLVLAGVGLDRFVVGPLGTGIAERFEVPDDDDDWRRSVASYVALYRPDTLARTETLGAGQGEILADLGGKLGLGLTPAQIDMPAMPLKRADLYAYDGEPIAFLAYLDPKNGPIAFCITRGAGDPGTKTERRHGMDVVYWSSGQHRFMLIGHAASADLQAMAATLQARFPEKKA